MSVTLHHLPITDPRPDAQRFIDILMGRVRGRPPLVEYLVDDLVMRPIVSDLLGREWVGWGSNRETLKAHLDNFINFWYRMGYDFVRFEQGLDFVENQLFAPDPVPGSTKQRGWVDQHHGTIQSWADFERYPWPRVQEMDFFAFEYINAHLPEGMGLMTCHGGGPFEHLSHIMSFEGLGLALYDAPDLVRAVSDKIGELMTAFYGHLCDLDRVIALFQGDDMGFRTSTLVSPVVLRKYVLPWHKRFAKMAHARGVPYFLHSCGNIVAIMEDLIEDVGLDGKHSFEDAIMPAQDFQATYGDRIAVLGGLDLNILGAASPQAVREKTRFLIEACGGRGRYAIGSGNSIPSYIPVENYLSMVDEAAG
ncbi:MAG: hypothetical protein JXA89_21745 [Anaerolineae bacterium]|nr:hypothetical protein [Anaerolineae bacterium]